MWETQSMIIPWDDFLHFFWILWQYVDFFPRNLLQISSQSTTKVTLNFFTIKFSQLWNVLLQKIPTQIGLKELILRNSFLWQKRIWAKMGSEFWEVKDFPRFLFWRLSYKEFTFFDVFWIRFGLIWSLDQN